MCNCCEDLGELRKCTLMTPYLLFSLSFSYENSRRLRVAIIHGMARMAALMASTYKAYLGVGLGPLSVRPFIK